MAYDPTTGIGGGGPSWTIPEKFLAWEVDHERFELKRLLGKGERTERNLCWLVATLNH